MQKSRIQYCIWGVFAALAMFVAAPAQAGDDPSFIAFHVGGYDVNDNETAGQLNIEYRSGWDDWYVKPFGGVMATTDAAIYGYAGFMLDIYFGRRFVFTPNVAVGLYSDGDGKDLGSVIEFRSGVELAYRFDSRTRLGVAFHHISNASISDNNPGTETLTLVLSLPLNNLFGDD
ncbi:MAG: acyloxyacyl hydrolase [Rhodospirillaceae bacterium]|nr:acyloxyacyl hydrolase [Rhodospirillaceae bacterium]MDD9918209.1 acyloxyacyl hydrolase [Rhodospirillaceae bacterium]MDD9925347.1 acyloxyacyl hydrolase [Rhodospirillaceae bacterium]